MRALIPFAIVLTALAALGKAEERPNIVFIMADDLGEGDLGCYGQQHIQTPHIDRLASEGMRFTQCYAGGAVCAPSRSVLMTGLHTGHTRVRGNFGIQGGVVGLGGGKWRVPLHDEDLTVAEVLQEAGYVTGMTGKWGLGEPQTTGTPNRQGFDQWFGYLNQRRAHTYYPTFIWLNEHRFDLPGNADDGDQQYTHDLFTGFALNFLRQQGEGDQPFFLYVPYTIPHSAFEVPDLGPYADNDWPERAGEYAAMVTRMDEHVGQIMSLLAERGLDERTIVFFCSDNGASNAFESVFDSNGPHRGKKGMMYEGGLRVPMIVRWPGKIAPGSLSHAPWYFADFMATAADLAGVSAPTPTDGLSVVPTLLSEEQNLADRFFYWEHFSGGFKQAVRWKDWKGVRLRVGGPLELYDLHADPAETTDVAPAQPEVVRHIEQYLKTARTESKEWPVER